MDHFALDHARAFSAKQRQRLAAEGKALADGSFPIVSKGDLRNAIKAYGRASSKARAKRHIIKRARALSASELLPDDWANQGAGMITCREEGCERAFATDTAAEDHALAVHSHGDIRDAVSKALREKFTGPPRVWVYVMETADDWVVYEIEGTEKLYRLEFSYGGGVATLQGEPVEVTRRVVYEPVGS